VRDEEHSMRALSGLFGNDWIGWMRGIVEAYSTAYAGDYGYDERSTFDPCCERYGVTYGYCG
jgi:hypothetical protein